MGVLLLVVVVGIWIVGFSSWLGAGPVILAILPVVFIVLLSRLIRSEKFRESRQRRRADRDLAALHKKASTQPFPKSEDFLKSFAAQHAARIKKAGLTPLIEPLRVALLAVVAKVYRSILFGPPGLQLAAEKPTPRHRDAYAQRVALLEKPKETYKAICDTLLEFADVYSNNLPASLHLTKGMKEPDAPFVVDIASIIDTYSFASKSRAPFQKHSELFGSYGPSEIDELFAKIGVPYGALPDAERFQHQWIVAPSGTGKTTLLETLIACDLPRVARGEASVFIMDSQNELIPKLAAMADFHPGGRLHGKLIVLEPDPDWPLALNIFDSQLGDVSRFSGEDRESLYASSLEMADFIMSGLLGADLTAKQKGIFRNITQALQVIPNATIHTFADLLTAEGYERHRDHILTLDEYTVDFFEKRFNTQQFKSTKEEIFWRLDAIMSNTTFRRMFSHPKNKLNLFDELQSAKVICVNTKLGLLKKDGTEIFGRYFLAMLLQATERRMLIDRGKRLPTFCYIDECHDYIADEPKMASLLDKARKQKVGFTLAHQRLANIRNADVLDALANVRIKYAARNRTDATYLAKLMGMVPELLAATPEYHFYFNPGNKPVLVTCPPDRIEGAPKASPAHLRAFRDQMRARYSEPVKDAPRARTELSAAAAEHQRSPAEPPRRAETRPQPAAPSRPRPQPPKEESDAPTDW